MRVDTDELDRQAEELRKIASRLDEIHDSVLRVARELRREAVGEGFYRPLRGSAISIADRIADVKKMRTALDQIGQLYDHSETMIVEETQGAVIHHALQAVGRIDIP